MADQPLRCNIEVKARCDNLDAAKTRAWSLGARQQRDLEQIDTYFKVPTGRLKLRQINSEYAELIAYHRANDPRVRLSAYMITPVVDAESLLLLEVAGCRLGRRSEDLVYVELPVQG